MDARYSVMYEQVVSVWLMKQVVLDYTGLILYRSAASNVYRNCFHCSHGTTFLNDK